MNGQAVPKLQIFVSTGAANVDRRSALRKSWFQYLHDPDSPLEPSLRDTVRVTFIAARGGGAPLAHEAEMHGDITLLDAPEGYEHLWRKSLVYLSHLVSQPPEGRLPDFVMHADDDSFIRLDLLLPLVATWPRQRFYWGYIWDGTGARVTAPIRNISNKSHMPEEQYPLDYYPPFASGCGFVLSMDLVHALLAQPLPDYRLLDPPFGIHLCGTDRCVLHEPVAAVHDERVRPYRPIPIFRPDTLVQHYLRAEEMRPYYKQVGGAVLLVIACLHAAYHQDNRASNLAKALEHAAELRAGATGDGQAQMGGAGGTDGAGTAGSPEDLYNTLVQIGLLRR